MRRKTKRLGVQCEEANLEDADEMKSLSIHRVHQFRMDEINEFRTKLLEWYQQKGRDLTWRKLGRLAEAQQKAYIVLVSEVMLQQTQVTTVEDYYKKWMARWPTFKHLSSASLDEVNEMWSGLGYYARGRRLYEAAKKIVDDLGGIVPQSALQLQKELPGVGRYTAGAVASIAFGERVPAVDGNVIRVLGRLRLIGGNSDSQVVMKDFWDIAETVVDPDHPGAFNEAMMDLGATVCTVKTPSCSSCPLSGICLAYEQTHTLQDIEIAPDCRLCMPDGEWDPSLGVRNFPRKAKKAPPREENYVVSILCRKLDGTKEEEYFLVKRPAEGLLASFWEFPKFSLDVQTKSNVKQVLLQNLEEHHGVKSEHVGRSSSVGEVKHLFSHIHHVYTVYEVQLKGDINPSTSDCYIDQQWVSRQQFPSIAMSTGIKKIFNVFTRNNTRKNVPAKAASSRNASDNTKRRKITDFFSVQSEVPK